MAAFKVRQIPVSFGMVSRTLIFLIIFSFGINIHAADWPQWRQDSGRTAVSTLNVGKLSDWNPLWIRHLPKPDPAFNDVRLQFDKGYEPIVLGKRIFISSNVDDSVTSFDTDSGKEIWKFYTDGPVRFAPVGGGGRVLFGSDDGYFYCVKASSGELVWKRQAVPSNRKLTGNRRLISIWPVRGGAVLKDDRVYFAAGVFPFEGVFVYCLEAATGKVIWLNDSTGHIYGQQPHGTVALGGLAPQGYLLINPENNELIVPSSNAYPARFELATGKLIEFKLPSAGRLPGGWFSSTPSAKASQKLKRRGLLVDADVNIKRHEDKPRAEGKIGIRSSIEFADQQLRNADPFPGLEKGEAVYSIIAGDGKIFVSTSSGKIRAYNKESVETVQNHAAKKVALPAISKETKALVKAAAVDHGYGIVLGDCSFEICSEILSGTKLENLTVINENADEVAALRNQVSKHENLIGKLHAREANPLSFPMPPYYAALILVSDSLKPSPEYISSIYESVRPFGGKLILPTALVESAKKAKLPRASFTDLPGEYTIITREGALEGSSDYSGGFDASPDALVKAPLGVLWFDDRITNFKRSPQPTFLDGTMISIDKDWTDASTRKGPVDYRLLDPRFSDVYTGRELAKDEVPSLRQSFANIDKKTIQPSQYRPKDLDSRPTPEKPLNSTRVNPITGETEPRVFPMAYGCDNGIDYGNLYTMRSATAAFYDKTNESGTINLSGPRSGCTNSVIPANGVLNVPYFFEGCTCSYPLPTGMSLYSLPESQEQWTAWGEMTAEQLDGKIQRLGINLGAPGDRVTRDGTLWVDHPASGGPSPMIKVTTVPEKPAYHYRHSTFMKSGEGHPWIAASGVSGLESLTIHGVKPGDYRVVLTFCKQSTDKTSFSVSVNGNKVPAPITLKYLLASQTRILEAVKSDGAITVKLMPLEGKTQLSGIELVRKK